jgi:hypothetical protein
MPQTETKSTSQSINYKTKTRGSNALCKALLSLPEVLLPIPSRLCYPLWRHQQYSNNCWQCDGARPCFNCTRRSVAMSCTYTDEAQRSAQATSTPSASSNISSATLHQQAPPSVIRSIPCNVTPVTTGRSTNGESSAPPEPTDGQVGHLFKSRDASLYFGLFYFGPQAAAKIIEAPDPGLSSGIRHAAGSTHSFRDVGGPFSQIWDLLGLLPRKKSSVDRITDCFLKELN